jgi:hypothetical protein
MLALRMPLSIPLPLENRQTLGMLFALRSCYPRQAFERPYIVVRVLHIEFIPDFAIRMSMASAFPRKPEVKKMTLFLASHHLSFPSSTFLI